ncbi:MAG: NAD(P)H-hydrate dehydratase [Candidatus Bathyarchaeota archaeon]|nr:NAD(P)H-hydrate dehydratase [Candidatus Bathyarchaeota archaeon]
MRALILDDALTSREMRAVEMNADYLGVSRLQLMENAGKAVADAVAGRFGPKTRVTIVCGTGGNGGDGFVAARHLAGIGYPVEVLLLGRREVITSGEALTNWKAVRNMSGSVRIKEIRDSAEIEPIKAGVIIDALIGTGVRGALSSPFKEMVQAVNKSEGYKIAVDVPTGVESDTGDVHGEAVEADLTLTFHKPKTGFKNYLKNLGEVEVCTIGVPPESESYAGPGDVYLASKTRHPESHKGDFGRLLVIGGSETYSGAPALTAMGAYATGVDIVYVAAPETAASIIAGFSPSMITVKMKGSRLAPKNLGDLSPFLDRVDAVAMGPGLGLHKDTVEAVNAILGEIEDKGLPVLLDADALKGFAEEKRKMRTEAVFTPHHGEFKILTGKAAEGSLEEKGETVRKEASRLGATVLLKGRVDIVSDGDHVRYNRTGNPGMTVGGTGDVLSGVVAGLMAMGVRPFEASVAGAFVNGAAGDSAHDEKGYHLEPIDLIRKISGVMEDSLAGRMRRIVL